MSTLAEQIAREHPPRIYAWACWCGWMTDDPDEERAVAHVRHIATVTERAVRERIEEELWLAEIYRSVLRRFGVDPDEVDAAFRDGLREATDD